MSVTTPRDARKEPGAKDFDSQKNSDHKSIRQDFDPHLRAGRRAKCRPGNRVICMAETFLKHLIASLDDVQVRWETDAFSENVSLTPLKRQPLAWLRYACQRLYDSDIPPRGYRIALAAPLIAALLTFTMRGLLHDDTALFFLGAVVISAGTGGLRAGLLTTALSLVPYTFLLRHPLWTDSIHSLSAVSLFVLLAILVCVLSDSLYIAQQQAEEAREQAESLARRSRFLAQASAMLDEPHDYESLLLQITRAIVPAFADGAAVDILMEDETLRRVGVTHKIPEKEAMMWELHRRFPLRLEDDHLLCRVMRSRQGELISEITGPLLASSIENAEYMQIADTLASRSVLCVPLIARGRCLGTLMFLSTSDERRYTHTDLAVAKDLALRVGLAIDNMRLYQEAQQEIAERTRMEQQIREANLHLERQHQALEEANIQLVVQANTDGLTELNNHRAFQEKLAKELQRTLRYEAPLSVLLLDVDKFKLYNDTYGHPAGDQVLKQVAAILRQGARDTDFVARYGGEEFVLILPNTDSPGALEMAERLRRPSRSGKGLSDPLRSVLASQHYQIKK